MLRVRAKGMAMKAADQNERLINGTLPEDPEEGMGPPLPRGVLSGSAMITAIEAATVGLDARARGLAIDVLLHEPSMKRGLAGPDGDAVRRYLAAPEEGPAKPPEEPPPTWAERVRAAGEVMARRASGHERPMATPWPGVNAALRGGFWPGAYSLTSSTGTGKTQWAIQCALHLAERFKAEHDAAAEPSGEGPDCVLYVALELGDVDMVARAFGVWAAEYVEGLRIGGTPEHEIRDTELDGLYWSDLFFGVDPGTCEPGPKRIAVLRAAEARFAKRLASLPLHVVTPPTRGWGCAALEALVRQHKPRFVVLDYAQLMSAPEGAREELRQTIGNVAKSARDLARRPGGPAVLILSSTARNHYGKVDGTGEKLSLIHI